MSTTTPTDFHEANRASEVLAKIGNGTADADFARAVHLAVDRCQETLKPGKVIVTVEFKPDVDNGSMTVRAEVSAKLPKLRAPASQMHVGPKGQLMTQQDWMFGGGRDETPLALKPVPLTAEQTAKANTASGRFPVAKAPAPAPVAAAPTPKPVVGKEAAAGEQA